MAALFHDIDIQYHQKRYVFFSCIEIMIWLSASYILSFFQHIHLLLKVILSNTDSIFIIAQNNALDIADPCALRLKVSTAFKCLK